MNFQSCDDIGIISEKPAKSGKIMSLKASTKLYTMNRIFAASAVSLLILATSSCIKPNCGCAPPPNVPIYLDLSSGSDHPTAAYLESVKLFWYDGGGAKVYENQPNYDMKPFRVTYLPIGGVIDSTKPLLVSTTSFIWTVWTEQRINTFYLEYPDRANDTLYMEGSQDSYALTTLTINGKVPTINPIYAPDNTVYQIQR